MNTKTIIQIIMGLSLYFSIAASADPGTQGPTNYGQSLGQVSPLSIESNELGKRAAKCLGQVLKEHVNTIVKSSIEDFSTTYEGEYYNTTVNFKTPLCDWFIRLNVFNKASFKEDFSLSMGAHCIERANAGKGVQFKRYSLLAEASKKFPRIYCKNSDLTNVVINHDTGEYSGTTNLSTCSVVDYEGETIEFYNHELMSYLEKAGKAKEIKPQFVYPRQQYAQCLQEAISH